MGAKDRAFPRRQTSRLRWALTMSSAIALAVIVTQPGRNSKERARLLVEREELAGKSWVDGSAEAAAAGEAEQLAAARKAAAAAAEADAEIYEPKLTGRAACAAAASIDPTPLHGWVKKVGPLPMGLLDGPQTLRRHQAYFDWRDAGASNASLLVREAQVDGKPGGQAGWLPDGCLPSCLSVCWSMLIDATCSNGLDAARLFPRRPPVSTHTLSCLPAATFLHLRLQLWWGARRRCSHTAGCW